MPDAPAATTEGQAPEAGATSTSTQDSTTTATTDTTATQGQAPSTGTAKTEGKTDIATLPPDVQDYIKSLRDEAAGKRVDTNKIKTEAEAEATRKIGISLGLIKDENAAPDAAALAAQAQEAQAIATATARELAVFKHAPDGVNVQGLLDSRSFLDSISKIDPTNAEALKTAIADGVKARPDLKVQTGAPRSGGDLGGGSNEAKGKVPTTLDGALTQHYAK